MLIVFMLFFYVPCHACWYEYDDDWYDYDYWYDDDDWYDYDDSYDYYEDTENEWYDDNTIWLDEVVCTPDDNYDNTDFFNWNDYYYDDVNDEYIDNTDDDNDDIIISDDYNQNYSVITPQNSTDKFYKASPTEKAISDKLPKNLQEHKQNTKSNCVPTVLEYVFNYLNNSFNIDYVPLRDTYMLNATEMKIDVYKVGVPQDLFGIYVNTCGFEMQTLDTYSDIKQAIDNGEAIIGELCVMNGSGTEGVHHEVMIIGYYTDDTSKVNCLNPATGNYETFLLSDFSNKTSVKSLKEN